VTEHCAWFALLLKGAAEGNPTAVQLSSTRCAVFPQEKSTRADFAHLSTYYGEKHEASYRRRTYTYAYGTGMRP